MGKSSVPSLVWGVDEPVMGACGRHPPACTGTPDCRVFIQGAVTNSISDCDWKCRPDLRTYNNLESEIPTMSPVTSEQHSHGEVSA